MKPTIPIDKAADLTVAHFSRTLSARGLYKELLKLFDLDDREASRQYEAIRPGIEKAQEAAFACDLGDACQDREDMIRRGFYEGMKRPSKAMEQAKAFHMEEIATLQPDPEGVLFIPKIKLCPGEIALASQILQSLPHPSFTSSPFGFWLARYADSLPLSDSYAYRALRSCFAALAMGKPVKIKDAGADADADADRDEGEDAARWIMSLAPYCDPLPEKMEIPGGTWKKYGEEGKLVFSPRPGFLLSALDAGLALELLSTGAKPEGLVGWSDFSAWAEGLDKKDLEWLSSHKDWFRHAVLALLYGTVAVFHSLSDPRRMKIWTPLPKVPGEWRKEMGKAIRQ